MHTRLQSHDHASSSSNRSEFQSRPFTEEADPALQSPAELADSNLQAKPSPAGLNHNFGHVAVFPAKRAAIQPKLTVGEPNDQYEQEADRVAEQVMSMSAAGAEQPVRRQSGEEDELQMKPIAASITPLVQREMGSEDDEELQAKPLAVLQRQASEEDELQMKPMSILQRMAPEEEEPVQAQRSQPFGSNLGEHDLDTQLSQEQGGGQSLPRDVRAFMEPRFGADFSQVRIHTDSNSVQMNRSLNAQAFTHRQDIYFNSEKYDPGSHSGKQLLAHELTHIVQQTGGQKIQRKSSEVAEKLTPTATNSHVMRRGGNEHVGGNSGSVTFLADERGEVVGPGQAGFSHRMLDQVGEQAEGLMQQGLYADARLRQVVPSLGVLDEQIKSRTKTHQRYQGLVRGDDAIFAPWGIAKEMYEGGRDWCQTHIDTMTHHEEEENEKFAQYNAWTPVGNGFFSSLLRLEAMQNMLGVNNPPAMASALASGLQEAGQVAARAADAFAQGNQSGRLTVPPADASVTQALNETNQSAQEMNTAYLGFRQNVLALKIQSINQEGATDRAKLNEINEVKQFVRNVGKTVDVTASVVSGAPAAITNVTNTVRHGEAMLNAHRNRSQILDGQRPTHNPTYLATNEAGEMVVRNVQMGTDRPAAGGEATPSPAGPSISLPSDVSSLLGTIADFAYASEVREINSRLEQIKTRCDSLGQEEEFLETRKKTQDYQDKLNAFALKMNALQQRLAERRQAYLQFGKDLDNFARQDRESQRAGQAPGRNEERFATIMTALGQVREVLTIGNRAKAGIFTPEEFRVWAQRIEAERSASPPRTDIPIFQGTGREEWARISSVYTQVRTFGQNVDLLNDIFSGVEAQAGGLMRQVHHGGGGGAY